MADNFASGSVKELAFTTPRDGGIDHLGVRTRRGIVDWTVAAGVPACVRLSEANA
jgi:hypothetical protein